MEGIEGAATLAARISSGELTAVEAVADCIARIEAADGPLNAVVVRRFDEAMEEARRADARRDSGEPLGPLHGVPVTVKECLDLTGTASTFGLENRRQHRATADEVHVARLRAAGAIVVGKTNVAQLLAFVETDNPVYGRTNNPRNHERSCGGSSGGEGAIIGAGASPLGLGTDIGGSCRVPAAWCGTVGLKPTAGRTPDTGRGSFAIGNQAITSVVGVLGPTVADVALGLEVINGGREPADLGQPRLGDPAAVDPARLTVAVFAHDGTFTASPAARRAVTEAADQLEAAGVRLVDWTPPGAEALALLYASLGADLAAAWKPLVKGTTVDRRIKQLLTLSRVPRPLLSGASGLLDRLGQESLAAGARLFATPGSIAGYFAMAERVADFRAATLASAQAAGIDAVLSPAVGMAAIRHGASYDLALMGAYTALYNTLGWPAGVVPYTTVRPGEETDRVPGKDRVMKVAATSEAGSAGLPVAVQVAAPPWREDVVLALLSRLEQPLRAATH